MLVLFLLLFGCSPKGVTIIITNQSQLEIKDIDVSYTGGSYKIQSLKPGELNTHLVNPSADSHLNIHYKAPDFDLKEISRDIGYFEPNYGGNIKIELKDKGKMNFQDNVTLP